MRVSKNAKWRDIEFVEDRDFSVRLQEYRQRRNPTTTTGHDKVFRVVVYECGKQVFSRQYTNWYSALRQYEGRVNEWTRRR